MDDKWVTLNPFTIKIEVFRYIFLGIFVCEIENNINEVFIIKSLRN